MLERALYCLMGFVIVTGLAALLSWAIAPTLELVEDSIHVKECR